MSPCYMYTVHKTSSLLMMEYSIFSPVFSCVFSDEHELPRENEDSD